MPLEILGNFQADFSYDGSRDIATKWISLDHIGDRSKLVQVMA